MRRRWLIPFFLVVAVDACGVCGAEVMIEELDLSPGLEAEQRAYNEPCIWDEDITYELQVSNHVFADHNLNCPVIRLLCAHELTQSHIDTVRLHSQW